MEALAKSKCFRRGYDFTGDRRMIIGLIILLTTTSFSNRQVQTGALSVHRKQNLKFDCADSRQSGKQYTHYRKKEIAIRNKKPLLMASLSGIACGFIIRNSAKPACLGVDLYGGRWIAESIRRAVCRLPAKSRTTYSIRLLIHADNSQTRRTIS